MSIDFLYEIYKQHNEVSTDSRRTPDGCLFFALRGETFDGNQFAAKALEGGAAVAVVDDASVVPDGDLLSEAQPGGHYIVVADVLETLQALAAYHRQQFRGPVIQVTGTNGKTTTKELLAAVLSSKFNVLYTQGNLNNHIGVPLTLLRLRPEEHEIAIIETGANHPGEIRFLTNIVRPDYGLITNVGRAHLEGFGSFEGVKRTKGELYDYLKTVAGARIFACASNPDLMNMLAEREIDAASDKCITYAHDGEALASTLCQGRVAACDPALAVNWQPAAIAQSTPAAIAQSATAAIAPSATAAIAQSTTATNAPSVPAVGCGSAFPAEHLTTRTQLIGDYNLDNVLAAICTGLHFGLTPAEINAALEAYHPSLGRSEYRRTAKNELIVDAYNANLTSMLAALKNFAAINHEHKMVILGDMRELGAASRDAHLHVVREVLVCGVEEAWFVGKEFADTLKEAQMQPAAQADSTGCVAPCIRLYADVQAVADAIAAACPSGRLILIKGSNSTRLHQLPPLL